MSVYQKVADGQFEHIACPWEKHSIIQMLVCLIEAICESDRGKIYKVALKELDMVSAARFDTITANPIWCFLITYISIRPGRMCCPGKCVLIAQGQCFVRFAVSSIWADGWRIYSLISTNFIIIISIIIPKNKTLKKPERNNKWNTKETLMLLYIHVYYMNWNFIITYIYTYICVYLKKIDIWGWWSIYPSGRVCRPKGGAPGLGVSIRPVKL